MESLGHLFKFNEGHIYCSPTVWMLSGGALCDSCSRDTWLITYYVWAVGTQLRKQQVPAPRNAQCSEKGTTLLRVLMTAFRHRVIK